MKRIFVLSFLSFILLSSCTKSKLQSSKKIEMQKTIEALSKDLKDQQKEIQQENMKITKESQANEKHIDDLNTEISMLSLINSRFKQVPPQRKVSNVRRTYLLPRFKEANEYSSPLIGTSEFTINGGEENLDIDSMLKNAEEDMVIDSRIKEEERKK